MSEELKLLNCPFCGGEAEYEGLYCYCTRCGCRMADNPDESEAIAAWNRRASPSTEGEGGGEDAREAAKRIVDWADNGKLADDEWLVERNETAIIAICRALLSSPDARREALEEAAKVADEIQASAREEIAADKEDLGDDYDPYSFGSGFLSGELTAAVNIAKAIRSLSPQGE